MTDTISLSDRQIIDGLRQLSSDVTRQYFYGYCRMAYCICNRRYQLSSKPGMDFYTLAHEYYLKLALANWQQLEDRKPGMSLQQWMMNGFRYLVLDRLKAWQKERKTESLEQRLSNPMLSFDVPDDHFKEDFHRTIEEICLQYYSHDRKSQAILRLLLIDGLKGKDIAAELGISPSAVTQRYRHMMQQVVTPYFKRYYSFGEVSGTDYSMPMDARGSQSASIPASLSEEACAPMETPTETRQAIFMDYSQRVTPDFIRELREGEVFVFGSNLRGMHGGGAARTAYVRFGAQMGQGVGLQGRSYAIPTMQGGPETIRPYVDEFVEFARQHPEMTFLVTRIGCGIAGFDAADIAPLFAEAVGVGNIHLPADFWAVLA